MIFKKKSNIRDPILQHTDPVDPHTKSEAGIFFRIDPAIRENFRMNHTAPKHFHPSRLLTSRTSFRGTDETGNVHLSTRLGEGKETGAESNPGIGTPHRFRKKLENPFQLGEGNILPHHQTFHLVKHRGMARIRLVCTKDLSRGNDTNRGLRSLHRPNLNRRGMRPQKPGLFYIIRV
ncbi:uncharacterized protein METZ01_LOCUS382258, partial [marine metagenome]